jgi:hypothetical protein
MDDKSQYVEVICLVLPSGGNLWFEVGENRNYLTEVLSKWKADHPEYEGTPSTSGAVHITMPRDKYNAIGAHCGPGCFVWP